MKRPTMLSSQKTSRSSLQLLETPSTYNSPTSLVEQGFPAIKM